MHGFPWLKHGLHHGDHAHWFQAFGRWLHEPAALGLLFAVAVILALLLLTIYLPVEFAPPELPFGYPVY